ncbi:MAG: histidine kinase [Bacteroidota bacterium]|nr:histidine kinase [Bacteroidota bacterium]
MQEDIKLQNQPENNRKLIEMFRKTIHNNNTIITIRSLRIMFLILIIHSPFYVFAQYFHSELVNHNGNIKGTITSIYQSKDGMMWFGTDLGIVRYDGTHYKTIKKSDNTSFKGIIGMVEDFKGNLWIHDMNGIYQLKYGKIASVIIKDSLVENQLFFNLKPDKLGNIWLSAKDQVLKLSFGKMGETKIKKYNTGGEVALGIMIDSDDNTVWVGIEGGLCKIIKDSIVKVINLEQSRGHVGRVWSIAKDHRNQIYFNDNFINRLEKNGTYTQLDKIGNSPMCGILMSRNNKTTVTYSEGGAALFEDAKFQKYLKPNGIDIEGVSAMFVDNLNNSWVAYGNKLIKFTHYAMNWQPFSAAMPSKKEFNALFLKPLNDSLLILSDNNYTTLTIHSRNFKLQRHAEISRKSLNINNNESFPSDVVSIGKDEYIISSMLTGLIRYNNQTKSIHQYKKFKENEGYLNLKVIDQTVWSGAMGFYAKIEGDKIQFFIPPGFRDISEVNSFIKLNNSDSVLIGTEMGIYLHVNNKVTRFINPKIKAVTKVKLIEKDKDNIWLIVDGEGVFIYNTKSKKLKAIVSNENYKEELVGIEALTDSKNQLWLKFQNRDKEWLLEEQSKNNYVLRIPRYPIGSSQFYNYGKRVLAFSNNTLFIASDSGVYKLDLSNPDFFTKSKPVKIISLKVRDIDNDSLLQLGKCTLKHTEGNLTFSFSRIDFENTGPINYEYHLEGSGSKSYNFSTENSSVTFSNLSPGNYKFYVRSTGNYNENGEMPFASYQFTILPPWYFTWWAYTLWAFLILSLFYLFFKLRINTLKRNAEIERNMLEAELKALRSQINPHYLSNSLMSLQRLILKDNKNQALEVLSLFGKVMRNILNSSEEQFVPLMTEINTIKEYMNLEGLLLFNEYQFNIHYDTIDPQLLKQIKIPSMLIQPFVENAIIHGLSKKQSDPKTLIIKFEFKESLICTIEDNGVGRDLNYLRNNHNSIGNKNVINRLKLYGDILKQNVELTIIDLKDDSNKPIGTKVVLNLPLKLKHN